MMGAVLDPSQTTVAFIGTGVMGASMAGHLMDAGCKIVAFNRTKAKAAALLDRGAAWAETPGEAAAAADVVITMVGYPQDVEEVYLADGGVVERAHEGAYLLDMTTSSPALAGRIAKAAAARGLHALDAPVSGGDVGARNATLTIMVGGDEASFSAVEPILRVMGKTVTLHGEAGAGQHCKMANQIMIAATMLGMCECLAYAEGAGLDKQRVIDTLSGGSAQNWSLANYGPRVLRDDFAPGFYVKHFVKDLRIALNEAECMKRPMPGLALAKRMYEVLANAGGSELGTQALWLLYGDAEARRAHGVAPAVSSGEI